MPNSYEYDTKFLITGAPRSGTLYMAEVFNRLGYRTGHETVVGVGWNGTNGYHPEAWHKFDGEVSHAIAHTPGLDPDWPLLHITRDPILVITSILNLRAIARLDAEYSRHRLHEAHPARVVDFLIDHFDNVTAKPNPYYRISQTDLDPTTLPMVVKHLTGDTVTDRHAEYALALRKNYNAATERLGTHDLEWTPERTQDWLMTNYWPETLTLFGRYDHVS